MNTVLIVFLLGSCLIAVSKQTKKLIKNEENAVDLSDDSHQVFAWSGSGLSEDKNNEHGEDETPDDDENVSENISGMASASGEDLEKRKKVKSDLEMDAGCKCEGLTCECCLNVDVKILQGEACIDARALPDENAVQVSLVWNGETKASVKKSLKHVSFCHSIVPTTEGCVTIRDISLDSEKFGGCISLKVTLPFYEDTFELGCFHTNIEEALNEAVNDVPIRLRHGRWYERKQTKIKAKKTTPRHIHKKNT
ncbi:uncharacterized protein LOC110234362 [Exaiptasia diaphana]|uniref:DUF4773 domain-containing protein n=1 Tax=Exaiptasia diaphana TaxID=2652724 RepID=A0A913WX21_EXADI|nr:uncharacterized protein LOC110234362 [Exaiptasia diaphana]KXJ27662.1 hypothetical protein AC249_AIPGENE16867 [Exaiptasia diaphana]